MRTTAPSAAANFPATSGLRHKDHGGTLRQRDAPQGGRYRGQAFQVCCVKIRQRVDGSIAKGLAITDFQKSHGAPERRPFHGRFRRRVFERTPVGVRNRSQTSLIPQGRFREERHKVSVIPSRARKVAEALRRERSLGADCEWVRAQTATTDGCELAPASRIKEKGHRH